MFGMVAMIFNNLIKSNPPWASDYAQNDATPREDSSSRPDLALGAWNVCVIAITARELWRSAPKPQSSFLHINTQ